MQVASSVIATRWTVYDMIEVTGGALLLPYFSTGDAQALRTVSRRFRAAVLAYPWDDRDTPVVDLQRWVRSFPRARSCRLAESARVSDWDLHWLRSVTWLSFYGSYSAQFTDAGVRELRAVRDLDLQSSLVTLGDKGLRHLAGIEVLRFVACGMTDTGLASIRGVRTLELEGDAVITDRGLAALAEPTGARPFATRRLQDLCIGSAPGVAFTDAGICAIGAGLVRLCLTDLPVVLTDTALSGLPNLQELSISACPGIQITNRGIAALAHVTALTFTDLDGLVADDTGFASLAGVEKLYLCSCQHLSITDAGLASLGRLHSLTVSDCAGLVITDTGFVALAHVGTLDFSWNRHARLQISEGGVAALQTVGLLDLTDTGLYFTTAERNQLESQGARVHLNMWEDDIPWESDSESHEDLLAYANGQYDMDYYLDDAEDDAADNAAENPDEAHNEFDGALHPEMQAQDFPEMQAQDFPEMQAQDFLEAQAQDFPEVFNNDD